MHYRKKPFGTFMESFCRLHMFLFVCVSDRNSIETCRCPILGVVILG